MATSRSSPADVAAYALESASAALRVCETAIGMLGERVAFLEMALLKAQAPTDDSEAHVDTATAALWLERSPQTLRRWARSGDGPLPATRINGALRWRVVDIHRALTSR